MNKKYDLKDKLIDYAVRIIIRSEIIGKTDSLLPLLKETDELISILLKSIDTAKNNK